MKEIDPGHAYELDQLDVRQVYADPGAYLYFVNRIGEKYPGNTGDPHPGVTVQEVIRVLIARMKYVESQSHSPYNAVVIDHLRSSLYDLECRAHVARGVKLDDPRILPLIEADRVEELPACPQCGHVCCTLH